jgi:two-component system chemotaxis sensor kinase CheA
MRRGKPRQGRLTLHAYHEGGQVHIDVSDDGAGLDLDKIRQKVIQRGLVTSDQAASLSPRELHNSIFLAGFTTADAVTSVSGRGVGMDVVKTSIEQVGGTIEIHSEPGAGTTFQLTVPLTLAIIPALIVWCGGQRFALAQSRAA